VKIESSDSPAMPAHEADNGPEVTAAHVVSSDSLCDAEKGKTLAIHAVSVSLGRFHLTRLHVREAVQSPKFRDTEISQRMTFRLHNGHQKTNLDRRNFRSWFQICFGRRSTVEGALKICSCEIVMDDFVVITRKFASVHIPSFTCYTQDMIDFSCLGESGVFPPLRPAPYLSFQCKSIDEDFLSARDPNQYDKLVANIATIPDDISFRALGSQRVCPLSDTPGPETEVGYEFPVDPAFDHNPEFRAIRAEIDLIPSIFG
jgi:hypothetical protein